MHENRERDECLERLWHLRERGIPASLATAAAEGAREECVRRLAGEKLVEIGAGGAISFTGAGEAQALRLIRCHRIAERLVHDVLGESEESSACEFEHLVETGVVDSICTLLGHPRECPHGYPIPEGDCCRRSAEVFSRRVVPLLDLDIGETARIAWVYSHSDAQLHALASMQIRPGAVVRLHQVRPSVVVEVEGANIAIDEALAGAINVWAAEAEETSEAAPTPGRHRKHGRRGFGRTK